MKIKQIILSQPALMLPVLMCLIGAATAGISIVTLFGAAIDEDKSRLTQMVRSQAHLMEAVADFDNTHNAQNHPDAAFDSTMQQIVAAHKSLDGFGETGEFVIGKLIDGEVALLQKPRHKGDVHFQIPEFVPVPMQRALLGGSGEIIAADYKGNEVLAAYMPVPILNIGLVAKIDTAEIYRPFIVAGLIATMLVGAMLALGFYAARSLQAELTTATRARDLILSAAGEGIYGVDLDGLCTFVNPAAAKMLGYEADELIGKPQHDLLHHTRPDGSFYPRTECPVYGSFKDGKVHTVDDEVFWHKDGGSIPVEYVSTPIFENGETVGAVVMFRDISERKQVEFALRASEKRFRDITESSTDWFWETDAEHRFSFISKRGPETIGIDPQQIIGSMRTDFKSSGQNDVEWAEHIEDMDNKRSFRDFEYVIKTPDDDEVIVSVNGVPRFDDNGLFLGYRGSARNVTVRRQAEQALQRSEQRFTKSQKFANIGTWDWNIQTGDLYWSSQIAPLFGYEEDALETTYDNFVAAIHPDDRKAVTDAVTACVETGAEYNIEHRVVWPDGTVRHLSEKGDVVRDENGQPLNMLGVVQDITDSKNMQSQLIQSSKMATLGEMATGVAHELNQPLNIIRMALNNIQRKAKKNAADPQYLTDKLDKIDAQVERATSIIDHMRIFGRKPGASPVALDPRQMVNSTLGLIGQQLRLDEIEVIIEAPENCRPILGHQVQVEQVLLNLIGNARDILKDKLSGDKRISVTVGEDTENVIIAVEDSGGGIAEDDLGRIFEPFYTTKEIGQGTGLGLSISYGIINDMGGTLIAVNTDDGARFVITLPQYTEDIAAA